MELIAKIRNYTLEDAILNYHSLKVIKVDLGHHKTGLKTLDYFFMYHRLQTPSKHHQTTFAEVYETNREKLLHIAERLGLDNGLKSLFAAYEMSYGTINQFRPTIAKWIYERFKPSRILDFSAGWGGRCLGAMACGIPYIGIDTNTNLIEPYQQIIALDPDADVTMHFQPAETFDYSSVDYDLIFTSPPYFNLEPYQNMPEYDSYQTFLDQFFVPVVMTAWYYLADAGHLVLNMPYKMFESLSALSPYLKETIQMPIWKRPGCKQTVGEQIYVWQKPEIKN